ncbi:MAG: LysR family transcriptional regulator [Rhizobium sp.]|nr:MAG: LysR family transcriptional regulator [Rhizobium sp.]
MANGKLFPPLAALRAFEAVGRLGGVRKAGKELGIDHAVISRHIRALETWVGTSLLIRESTGYTLTDAGRGYHDEIYKAITLIGTATGGLMQLEDQLRLRIWCIPGFGFLWLSDRLSLFLDENPDVDLDFRPADDSPDFRAKDIDGDIRYLRYWEEADIPSQVHCMEFARPPVFPVASPAFVATMPKIDTAEDLLGCTLLHEDSELEWHHWFLAQGMTPPPVLSGPRLWHAHLTLNAARQGAGIALANPMLLRDDLQTGRLVRVERSGTLFAPVHFGGYTLLARADRWNAGALTRFRRWLRSRAEEYLLADPY